MNKEYKVVMLPTENESNLCIDLSCNELNYFTPEGTSTKHTECQHLYFVSDEEIKEGDWYIYGGTVCYCKNEEYIEKLHKSVEKAPIVATSDPALTTSKQESVDGYLLVTLVHNKLPQIPESYIKKYVEGNGRETIVRLECYDEKMIKETEEGGGYLYKIDERLGLIKGFSNTPSISKALEMGWRMVEGPKLTGNEVIVVNTEPKIYTKEDMELAYNAGRDSVQWGYEDLEYEGDFKTWMDEYYPGDSNEPSNR